MERLKVLALTRYPWLFNRPGHPDHEISQRNFVPVNKIWPRSDAVTVFDFISSLQRKRRPGLMTSSRFAAGIRAATLAPAIAACIGPASASEGSSFFESFERLSKMRWYISDGWTNGEHQNCLWTKRNLRISDGMLQLILSKAPPGAPPPENPANQRAYHCAEIQTTEKFGYGTYEVRMSAAGAPGLVTAFFTYIGPPNGDRHDEIDFEFLGKDKQAVQLNYFGGGQGQNENLVKLSFDVTEQLADYAFIWEPDSIRWFINGEFVHEAKRQEGKDFPSQPSKIFLSIWASDTQHEWLGKFADPGKPLVARYDWVSFTKLGEGCQFTQSVLCKLDKDKEATRTIGSPQR